MLRTGQRKLPVLLYVFGSVCYYCIVDTFTHFLSRVLRPLLAPASRWLLAPERKHPTWQYETALVALVLIAVALATSPSIQASIADNAALTKLLIIWLSTGAVLGSFLHAKVGYRMSEALEASSAPDVSCYEWSGKYWLFKEILWLAVFILSGAYPAIAGTVLFIVYPAWRKIHLQERKKLRA